MPARTTPSALRDPLLWLAILLLGGMLAWLSLARYAGFNAGMYDLGNMAQAIWSVTQGKPLLYSDPLGTSFSRLAGHAEVIYFLLAPLYALLPDPRVLVLAQAVLFALGAVPVYRMAARRTESVFAARALALIYLLYPTAQTGVLFDLHGDTLALPLLLFALDALDTRSWRALTLWTTLALLCKIYVAAPVAVLGLVTTRWGDRRRAGVAMAAAAVLYGLFLVLVIHPLASAYTAGAPAAEAVPAAVSAPAELPLLYYLRFYFGQYQTIRLTLGDRLLNVVVVFGPVLLVAWRGWRWLLPGLPIAIAALISTGPAGTYDYRYHHYATVVPFIIMAAIDGTARLQAAEQERRVRIAAGQPVKRRGRTWRGDLGLTLAIVVIFSALLVNTPLNPLFWLRLPGYGFDPSSYGVSERDALKERFLAERVPPGVTVAASTFLATRLVNRSTLYLVRYPDEPAPERLPKLLPQVRYAVPDALFDHYVVLDNGYGGGIDYDRESIGVLLRDPSFALTGMRDGLLLFEWQSHPRSVRDAPAGMALRNTLERRPDDRAAPVATFGEQIGLVQARVEQVGPRRLRASFTWRLQAPFARGGRYVAVSRLEGVPQARFVHLPTFALHPAWEWKPGELIEETFEVELPPELVPGTYTWRLGWYDVSSPVAMRTDQRSLMPGSAETAITMVVVR